jgi:hypothetical protein
MRVTIPIRSCCQAVAGTFRGFQVPAPAALQALLKSLL